MNGAAGDRPADRAPRERRQRRRREDRQDAFHFARRGRPPARPGRARHRRGDPCRCRGAGRRPPDLGLRALRRGRGRVPRLTRVPGAPAWTSPSPTGISASSSPRQAAPSGASPRGVRMPRSRSSGSRRKARPARRSPPAASRWSPSATASAPTASPSTARSTGSCPTPTGDPHYLHGDGWTGEWSVVEAGETTVRLGLDHAGGGTPYAYRAEQGFALDGAVLTLSLSVTNRGPSALPFGLGWHPFSR